MIFLCPGSPAHLVRSEANRLQKQPDLAFEMRILDESGKPVRAKPYAVEVNKDVPADAALAPAQFLLPLNRAGKFTVELTATDKAGGKKAQVTFPLTVAEAK